MWEKFLGRKSFATCQHMTNPLVKQSRYQMAHIHAARCQAPVERALLSYIIRDVSEKKTDIRVLVH